MSKEFKLSDRTKKFCGSINFKELNNCENLDIKVKLLYHILECNPLIDTFYLIGHGETETKHLHYIICYKNQIRGQTVLNYLAEAMEVNPLAVNIQKLAFIGSHLRYIIHQDPDSIKLGKKRYEITDIQSNDNKEIIEGYISSKSDDLTYDFLRRLVIAYPHEYQIMERLELKLYHKYRAEIKTLLDSRSMLMVDEELPF